MSVIKVGLLSDVKSKLTKLDMEQLLLAITAASIFMPFIITCAILLVTVTVSLCMKNTRLRMFCSKTNIPIYIFLLLLFAVPLYYGRYISVLAGVGILFTLLFFLYAKSIMSGSLFELCMDICCISSAIPFIYSIVQKLVMGIDFRTTGGLLNANYYGTICEFIIIIAVYRIISSNKNKNWYIAVIAMNIAGIFLCDCQSAWIAAMAGAVSMLFFNANKKHGFIFLAISVLLVIIGVLIPGILPRMELMPQTFLTRINIWETASEGIKAHPFFGQGAMTYLFIYELYDGYKTYHAHSLYLDPFLSYGIVGVSLIISYVVIAVKQIIINIKIQNNKRIMFLVMSIFLAVCIHGITDITLAWVQTGMFVLLIASGIFCKIDKSNIESPNLLGNLKITVDN